MHDDSQLNDVAPSSVKDRMWLAARERDAGLFDAVFPEVDPLVFYDRNTPLMWAAKMGLAQWVEKLIPLSDLSARSIHFGETPLMLAAESGSRACVECLLPYSDARAECKSGTTALMMASIYDNPECVELLMRHDDPMRAKLKDGQTPLMFAALNGSASCVEVLLPRSNPYAKNAEGSTALMLAAGDDMDYKGVDQGLACIRMLLEHSDIKATNRLGSSALMMAAYQAKPDRVEALMRGSDVDAQNVLSQTALMICADVECARHLLTKGNARLANDDGETALMRAAEDGNRELVALLLPHSEIEAIDRNGHCATDRARQRGRDEVVSYLTEFKRAQRESAALELEVGQPTSQRKSARSL